MFAVVVPFGLGGVLFFAFWIWAVVDVYSADSAHVRGLPKPVWLVVVLLLPTVGAVAWYILGRPVRGSLAVEDGGRSEPKTRERPTLPPAPLGPEDSPQWQATTTPSRPESAGQLSDEALAAHERRLLDGEAEQAKQQAAPDDASKNGPERDQPESPPAPDN